MLTLRIVWVDSRMHVEAPQVTIVNGHPKTIIGSISEPSRVAIVQQSGLAFAHRMETRRLRFQRRQEESDEEMPEADWGGLLYARLAVKRASAVATRSHR